MDKFEGTSYGVIAIGLLGLWLILRIAAKLRGIGRTDDRANRTIPGQEFELRSANSITESYDHLFIAMAIIGVAAAGVLYTLGRGTGEDFFGLAGFVLVLSLAMAWGMRRQFRGTAEVGSGGLTLRVGGKTFVFRWNDIAEARVTDWASTPGLDGLWARLSRTDLHQPFIQLRLSRRLRMNDLLSKYSTDGDGIPMFKQYRIFIESPATLAEIIGSYIREAGNPNAVLV